MRGIIPIPRDNMNDIIFNAGPSNIITNISTNGYYGYQPQSHYYAKNGDDTREESGSRCDMDMELEQPQEESVQMQKNVIPRQLDRKRRWEHKEDAEIFKKRREEEITTVDPREQLKQPAPAQTPVYLRKPTHNIPDIPRCLMGHYV